MSRCAMLSVWSGQKAQGDATVRFTLAITMGARAPLALNARPDWALEEASLGAADPAR